MISFALSEEQLLAQAAAAKFAASELRPIANGLSAIRESERAQALSRGVRDKISALGLVQGLALERQGSRVLSTIMLEELAWGDANAALAVAAPLGFVRALVEQGSAEQQDEVLSAFGESEHVAAAIVAAEPGLAVSGLKSIQSEVVAGRLNGRKALAPFAADCRYFLVVARYSGRLGAFIVPADADGVHIEAPREAMGCSSSEMADVTFKDVAITSSMRLGGETGCDVGRLSAGSRIAVTAILSGVARAAYEHAISYVKERKVAGELLAVRQAVAVKIADMFADSETMRWMGWRAAGELDSGGDAVRASVLAHGRAIQSAGWIVDESLQFMGGHGYMSINPTEGWYRNAKTISTLETALGV